MKLSRTLQLLIPPLLALIILILSWVTASLIQTQADERQREHQLAQLAELRGKLEGELNGATNLTAGLVAYVSIHGDIDSATFDEFGRRLLDGRSLIRNITLAPQNIIRYVYPFEGNQAALGLDLMGHNIQGSATRRMVAEGKPVLAGPVELVQGGRGLIHRVPIYLDLSPRPDGTRDYWGLMSTPIDYDALLEVTGLNQLSGEMEIALRGIDGLGGRGLTFFGNPDLFNQSNSLISEIRVLGGSWQMAARPLQDDRLLMRWLTGVLYLGGMIMAVLMGFFSWHVGRQAHRLEGSERLYRELTEHMKDVVFQTDIERRVTYLNPAWEALTGRAIKACLGQDWVDLLDPLDRPRAEGRCVALIQQTEQDTPYTEEFRVRRQEGESLWMVIRADIHRDGLGKVVGTIGTMVDISERKLIEEQIHHMAMHDNLTGLPNRRLLQDRFSHAQARLMRQGKGSMGHESGLAFLFLDLDGFKGINDRFGHDEGDHVLQEVVQRFQAQLREVDTLARLGGDEFALLLDCQGDEQQAVRVAEKMLQTMQTPFLVKGEACKLGVSIGIALYPQHGPSLDELIGFADKAMYHAKESGKGRWVIHPTTNAA